MNYEEERAEEELQIRYEDSFMPNGERICVGCEQPFDPATMYDEKDGKYVFKICGMCGGAGAQSYRLNFEPSAYGVDPYKEFGIAKDFEMGHEPAKCSSCGLSLYAEDWVEMTNEEQLELIAQARKELEQLLEIWQEKYQILITSNSLAMWRQFASRQINLVTRGGHEPNQVTKDAIEEARNRNE